jgi:hypothetical protein
MLNLISILVIKQSERIFIEMHQNGAEEPVCITNQNIVTF